MKSNYGKPMFHYLPLVEGMDADNLAFLPDNELLKVVQQCKAKEGSRVFQANPDFVVTSIADEYMAVPTGEMAQLFNGMVSLNKTGFFIWEQFKEAKTLDEVLTAAKQRFADEDHCLDLQLREYVTRFNLLNLLIEIK